MKALLKALLHIGSFPSLVILWSGVLWRELFQASRVSTWTVKSLEKSALCESQVILLSSIMDGSLSCDRLLIDAKAPTFRGICESLERIALLFLGMYSKSASQILS